ncbi:MAG: TIGR00159 family protein [Bacteroidetes bacterium]|nr:TIGR00159 family protein [Bacteroidota bacterium]
MSVVIHSVLALNLDFLVIRFLDVVDVLLVALLIYLLYKLLKGTIAANIFIGLLSIYFLWLIVKLLNMKLLDAILGQFIGVGVILVLIVFQQEIRKFLLIIGQRSIFVRKFKMTHLLPWNWKINPAIGLNYSELLKACSQLSKSKTGALIVITKSSELRGFSSTGTIIDGELSVKLLNSIFNKSSPLHDGAVIVVKNKIRAASCILPLSDNNTIPDDLGLRHRAALGISEQSDAIAIAISEESGNISLAIDGQLDTPVSMKALRGTLDKNFLNLSDITV